MHDAQLFRLRQAPARFPCIANDLLNSSLKYFDIQRNLSCAQMLMVLTKDVSDLRLVELNILDKYPGHTSKFRWQAK